MFRKENLRIPPELEHFSIGHDLIPGSSREAGQGALKAQSTTAEDQPITYGD